jgi:hypothetical protein
MRPNLEKTLHKKRAGGVAQGIDPEFKTQSEKKNKKTKKQVNQLLVAHAYNPSTPGGLRVRLAWTALQIQDQELPLQSLATPVGSYELGHVFLLVQASHGQESAVMNVHLDFYLLHSRPQ